MSKNKIKKIGDYWKVSQLTGQGYMKRDEQIDLLAKKINELIERENEKK